MKARIELWAGLVIVGAALAGTGCIPEPPSLVLTVTTTDDGSDAAPGDGICEVTAGAGDCTLRAAVHEANAGDGAQIVLAAGQTYVLGVADGDGDPDLDITSQVILRVDGPSGSAGINAGSLVMLYAEVRGIGATAAVESAAGATTAVGASLLLNSTFFGTGTFLALESTPHCTGGSVASLGYNYAGSTDCALGAVGDVAPGSFSPLGTWPGTLANLGIPANAPTIDRIPVGTLGCGTTVLRDVAGDPRPTDGDGDTVAACDIGAIERPS